ncbi:MAG TPA: alpha/beta fold hydrolase [Candidatus Acidoferrales bacterium]|jgi:dipeptidyl aminopeptidase/acylaminoacyl peptidase|nr:alpha/beta fold hydrolase [Candidatus Acidoferrales bacterium]
MATPIAGSQSKLELIRIDAEDGVALNGLLWEPQRASDSLVILVPGGTTGAALFPAHDYAPLAAALTERGYAFLLSNMRASYNNAYAEYRDAVEDIAAFVAYAKARGYEKVAILGISLGGPRMAQYMAERGDPAVKAVGFVASIPSPYGEFQLRNTEADKRRLEETLAHAREMVAQGKGEQPVAYDGWFPGVSVMGSAKALISFFGAPSDASAPSSIKFGSKIRVPALVIHGDKDELALPPNAQAIYDSLSASPQRDLVWVKGASHYLSPGPLAEAYAKQTVEWLVKNAPAAARR